MDNDLETMTPAQLAAEVRKLRAAIRQHRGATGHDLCWHQPDLWALLPEGTAHVPVVPEWPAFLRGCIRYRQFLDQKLPAAPRCQAEFQQPAAPCRSAQTAQAPVDGSNAEPRRPVTNQKPKKSAWMGFPLSY